MFNKSFLEIVFNNKTLLTELIQLMESEASLPNIKTPTMGGDIFWTNLVGYNGIRLQQNDVTKHCRLLDSNNIRLAWGTKNGMIKALDTLYELNQKYNS